MIAVSVAVMPATAGIMPTAKASQTAVAHDMAGMPADCEHHAPARDSGQKSADNCASMAACAASCFNYAGTVVPAVAPAPTASRPQPIAAAGQLVSRIGSPPFRPPRI